MKTNSITKVMTKNVVCVSPDQDILDVKHIYEKKEFHHHIPVVENDKLVGMVSLLDFMYHISGAGMRDDNAVYKTLKVKDIMTPNPFYMTSEANIEEVANILTEGNYHAVPILENDKVVGIVSTADIIKHFLQEA
ncbi:CBS domain-containing protein [uncultured Psychroserpens sp.]|uniref:CBS domain-containing protein n=1 Tax=uncultured Psychroserpens sp. TaxID=255436 RepID=UPI00260D5FA8|nr:CBS domain-containing protein [uncultured Psychroserpens sp.]